MSRAGTDRDTPLGQFSRTCQQASSQVIRSYSTSFGLATRLLGARHRQHIRNVYAMVRVADEIVDGVAAEAGLSPQDQQAALDTYAAQTHAAVELGYSCNVVLHAFAVTARTVGIDASLIDPFFASMRSDIDTDPAEQLHGFEPEEHRQYVYGSAEVVGLMCLRVFLNGSPRDQEELVVLERGARQLGAAFQNVNFLRDLGDDTRRLHRSYLTSSGQLDDQGRDAWLATIRSQLVDARLATCLLPKDCRAAVRSATALFTAVADRTARLPSAELYRRRVRVGEPIKMALIGRELARTWWER